MPGLNDLAPKLPFGRRSARLSRRWQAETGDHVIAMAWSPGGTLLAAASVGGPITILDAATGAIRHTLPGHGFGTTAVGWNADGAHFASAGQDAQVRLWDLAAGRERLTLDGGEAWVERLTWHPRENLLACAAGRRLRLWEPQGRLVREYPAHASTISDLCWRPGSTDLTSASYGAVTLWSPEGEEPLRRFQWKGSVLALAWSPDGKYLATGDQDSTVHFWIYRTGEDLQMSGYPTKVRELSWRRGRAVPGHGRRPPRHGLGLFGQGTGRIDSPVVQGARATRPRAGLPAVGSIAGFGRGRRPRVSLGPGQGEKVARPGRPRLRSRSDRLVAGRPTSRRGLRVGPNGRL